MKFRPNKKKFEKKKKEKEKLTQQREALEEQLKKERDVFSFLKKVRIEQGDRMSRRTEEKIERSFKKEEDLIYKLRVKEIMCESEMIMLEPLGMESEHTLAGKRKEQREEERRPEAAENKEAEERKRIGELFSKAVRENNKFATFVLLEKYGTEMESWNNLSDEFKNKIRHIRSGMNRVVKPAMQEMIENPKYEWLINKYSVDGSDLHKYLKMLFFLDYDLKRVVGNTKAFEAFFSNLEQSGFQEAIKLTTRVLGNPKPS